MAPRVVRFARLIRLHVRAASGGNLSLALLLLRVIWRAKAAGTTGRGGPLLALLAS
jgi:hypothetical protein